MSVTINDKRDYEFENRSKRHTRGRGERKKKGKY